MTAVLILSPSAPLRSMASESLPPSEYAPMEASDSLEALRMSARKPPEIFLIDSGSAPVNGYQMVRLLRQTEGCAQGVMGILTDSDDPAASTWARLSGADFSLPFSGENMERLPEEIQTALTARKSHHAPDKDHHDAPDDAHHNTPAAAPPPLRLPSGSSYSAESILPLLSSAAEESLFRLSMPASQLEISTRIHSLEETARLTLEQLTAAAEIHMGALILPYQQRVQIYGLPSREVYREEAEQFLQLCLEDFHRRPETQDLRDPQQTLLGIQNRRDFEKTRIDGRRLSSYQSWDLRTPDGTFAGTLHAGNLQNNYFTGRIAPRLAQFARSAAPTLKNAVDYNELQETRNRIEQIFAKFVPREVIRNLLDQSDDAELQLGEKRELAILFADIRSFTDISEHNSAEDIVDVLNRYFDRMSRAIRAQGGFIDKFIGDAILAVFGAPVSYTDNAERAVRAALDMTEALPELDTSRLTLPEIGFQIGIGVHAGQVIVGNIGSRDKFDYTVIGDNVNLASRLEGLTKHYKQSVIVSDSLAESLTEEDLFLREVDTVKVKGKEKPTTLYSVSRQPHLDPESLHTYRKGVRMFQLGNWTIGREHFDQILQTHPDDFLSTLYRQRCLDYAENPPDHWDGAIKLDFK